MISCLNIMYKTPEFQNSEFFTDVSVGYVELDSDRKTFVHKSILAVAWIFDKIGAIKDPFIPKETATSQYNSRFHAIYLERARLEIKNKLHKLGTPFNFEEKYKLTSVLESIINNCTETKILSMDMSHLKSIDNAIKEDRLSSQNPTLEQIETMLYGVKLEAPENY